MARRSSFGRPTRKARVEFVNVAFRKFYGITLEQLHRIGWQSLVHPDDHEHYVNVYQNAVAKRGEFRGETRVRSASGDWRWIESYATPRMGPRGEFLGYVGVSLDVTAAGGSPGSAARGRSTQGPIPRDPGARAQKSAGAYPLGRRDVDAAKPGGRAAVVVTPGHSSASGAHGAAAGRPPGRCAHHAGQGASQNAARRSRHDRRHRG